MKSKTNIVKLEDLFDKPIRILMIPPRQEDWTKHAIDLAKKIPSATIFYGTRCENSLDENESNLPINYLEEKNIPTPSSNISKLQLMIYKTFNPNPNLKIIPFHYYSYINEIPVEKNSIDLAITQTPNGSDVMLYMYYGIHQKPSKLFSCLKPNAYWIHMSSSLGLERESYPFFELINKGKPEEFENELLRKIFGKNGWRLSKENENYLKSNIMLGEFINGENSWMLYKRLIESREPIKSINK